MISESTETEMESCINVHLEKGSRSVSLKLVFDVSFKMDKIKWKSFSLVSVCELYIVYKHMSLVAASWQLSTFPIKQYVIRNIRAETK